MEEYFSAKSQDYIENNLKYKDSVKKIIKDVEKNNFDVNNASKIIFDSIFKKKYLIFIESLVKKANNNGKKM